jgi:hypothetical protein
MEGAQQEPDFYLSPSKFVDYGRRLMGSRNSLLSNQWAKIDRLTVTNVTNCRNPLGSPEVKPFGLNSYPPRWAKTPRLFNIHISVFPDPTNIYPLILKFGYFDDDELFNRKFDCIRSKHLPTFIVFLPRIYSIYTYI